MAKRKEIVDLYGEQFTVTKGNTKPYYRTESIYTAYDKPSVRKMVIWEYWQEWLYEVARDNNRCEMYVSSFNAQFFSIGGTIESPLGDIWAFYITATRQELWRIN